MKSLVQSFFSFLKKRKFPTKEDLSDLLASPFSLYKAGFYVACMLVIALFLSLLLSISHHFSTEVPAYGGTLSEGVIGAPRFINPLLGVSETDQTLTTLLYAGLVKEDDDGVLVPVLAERFVVSPDGKEYRFTLKKGLVFSDNKPLSSTDVVFTFTTKQRIALQNDPTSDWSNVTVETPEENTVVIRTTGSAEALKEKLSLGIVPKALWEKVDIASLPESTLNSAPVGAGPFTLKRINYSSTVPKEVFLKRNLHFAGEKPFIKEIDLHIFANQLDLKDGLASGDIASTNMLSGTFIDKDIQESFTITPLSTEKTVSLFVAPSIRSSTTAVALKEIRTAIDKQRIIAIIENGYGRAFDGALNPSLSDDPFSALAKLGYKQNESGILTKAGIPVTVPIAVRKEESLLQTAQVLTEELARFGIQTEVKVFDQGLFTDQMRSGGYSFILGTQNDAPRDYEALLPLYTKLVPIITSDTLHIMPPQNVSLRTDIFRDIEKWYIRTDTVWNIFK